VLRTFLIALLPRRAILLLSRLDVPSRDLIRFIPPGSANFLIETLAPRFTSINAGGTSLVAFFFLQRWLNNFLEDGRVSAGDHLDRLHQVMCTDADAKLGFSRMQSFLDEVATFDSESTDAVTKTGEHPACCSQLEHIMRAYVAGFSALACMLAGSLAVAQTQRALLIGINTYQPAGTTADHPAGCIYGRCELGTFENLDGSVNDAQAMADLLTSPKFGFPATNVTLLTNPAPPHSSPGVVLLPADQTTHDGILAAMQKYLVDVPQKGDTVVFYDASHGSLRVNSKGNKLTVLVNGQYVHADSTMVPSDAYKGGYDVRDREMTRIFNAALDKGVHLTVIFDSCHSGGISRGIGPVYRERALAFDPRDINEAPETLPTGQPRPAPTQRADNAALVFSAAQQDQTAKEMPAGAEPHGAFTAALLQALQAMPADTPSSVVYERVKAVLEGSNVPDQEPDLDATAERREQPLFGGVAAKSDKVRAAALGTNDDGSVSLDIGRASGLGVGSEFTATSPNSAGQTVQVRITSMDGLARSSAEIVSPAGAKIAPGDLFELSKWIPADNPPLLVWLWPSNLAQNQIDSAAAQVQASSCFGLRSSRAAVVSCTQLGRH